MIAIRKMIEEYSNHLASELANGSLEDQVTYPPNTKFADKELVSLQLLASNQHLQSTIAKLVANNTASVFFDFFTLIDGTSDLDETLGEWTELAFVDKTDDIEPTDEMLGDKLYETYWQWRKLRPDAG